MKLVKYNDPILKQEAEDFDFSNPPSEPMEFSFNLADTMMKLRGFSLCAQQVGLPYAVFVVGNPEDRDSVMAVFNPLIVDYGNETEYAEESSLTFPGLFIKIKRSKQIRVRYTTANGQRTTQTLDGLTARLFQQQYDHLQGCLYTSVATRYHREQAMKQKKKLDKERLLNA